MCNCDCAGVLARAAEAAERAADEVARLGELLKQQEAERLARATLRGQRLEERHIAKALNTTAASGRRKVSR